MWHLWPAKVILNFQICKILMADSVWRVQTHHRAKCRQNWSFHCGDIAIFQIFKMAAASILNFWNCEILLANRVLEGRDASACQILSKLVNQLRFFDFSRWRPSAILDSFGACLDHPQWEIVGLYHSAKFGYDRCNNFYNMNISIFGTFGWKMPIHAPKIGVFGNLIPQMGCNINQSQKRHTTAWVHVIWAIKCENVVSSLTCRWDD